MPKVFFITEKELKNIKENIQEPFRSQILKRAKELEVDPVPHPQSIILEGAKDDVRRVRQGDYRIVYYFYPQIQGVMIIAVDKRSDIYTRDLATKDYAYKQFPKSYIQEMMAIYNKNKKDNKNRRRGSALGEEEIEAWDDLVSSELI